jgi:carbamate kinase
MKKKIVIALGGNALGNNLPEQMEAVKHTAKALADLIEEGHQIVITHGNGPQVGMISVAMGDVPMSVCVGMSQGYIGYDLQNAVRTELLNRGINKPVTTLVTQVCVDPADPAFNNPKKPIGRFMTEEEAKAQEAKGVPVMEDAGRGWRKVVASPRPVDIVEKETIKTLVEAGEIVIACGGGGIPVMKEGNGLKGASAVIDKDFASALLAKELDADYLIILTGVEKVALNYGTPEEKWLSEMSIEDTKKYISEGHFAPGSMLPKVEAALQFSESAPNRKTLITLLEKAKDGIAGKTGTVVQ